MKEVVVDRKCGVDRGKFTFLATHEPCLQEDVGSLPSKLPTRLKSKTLEKRTDLTGRLHLFVHFTWLPGLHLHVPTKAEYRGYEGTKKLGHIGLFGDRD
jgi:hypothetical protein